jgi:hypothetical protein
VAKSHLNETNRVFTVASIDRGCEAAVYDMKQCIPLPPSWGEAYLRSSHYHASRDSATARAYDQLGRKSVCWTPPVNCRGARARVDAGGLPAQSQVSTDEFRLRRVLTETLAKLGAVPILCRLRQQGLVKLASRTLVRRTEPAVVMAFGMAMPTGAQSAVLA